MRVKLVRIVNQNQCNSNKMVGQSGFSVKVTVTVTIGHEDSCSNSSA